LIYSDLSR